jgi:hypothetical protein
MIELGLLGVLILILVTCITMLRRNSAGPDDEFAEKASVNNPARGENLREPFGSKA